MRRTRSDWLLVFATSTALTAVCGAYLGAIWPDGWGAAVTFVVSLTFLPLVLRLRWS